MQTAKASVIAEAGGPATVEELPVPELADGDALVEVSAATLCGTDVGIWRGSTPGRPFPYVVGHEGVGRLSRIDGHRHDVTGRPLDVGDMVLWTYAPCGSCYYCSVTSQSNLCETSIRFGRSAADRPPYLLGACAEMHFVPAGSSLVRVPEHVAPGLAASAACALRTVMHGFELMGPVSPHETVVVQGAGPVGLYALAVSLARGANRVLMIGAPSQRLELATRLGAADTFDLDTDGDADARQEWVRAVTEGRGADIVIQCAGTVALPESLALVRKGGRVVTIGGGRGERQFLSQHFTAGVCLFSVRSAQPRHFYQAISFLASRDTSVLGDMLSKPYDLSDVGTALERLAAMDDIKPLVVPRPAG